MNYSEVLQEAADFQILGRVAQDRYLNQSENATIEEALSVEPNANEPCFSGLPSAILQSNASHDDPEAQVHPGPDLSETYNASNDSTCLFENSNSSTLPFGPYGYSFPIEDPSFAYVQYCLAQKSDEHCRVSFSVLLLSIVMICNILKTASLMTLLLLPNFIPIGTSTYFFNIVISNLWNIHVCMLGPC